LIATFLEFGELMNFWRLGFFMYWQRQGLCSLSLAQHMADGGLEEVIALAHELSSIGLQVTAIDGSSLTNKIIRTMHRTYLDMFSSFSSSLTK